MSVEAGISCSDDDLESDDDELLASLHKVHGVPLYNDDNHSEDEEDDKADEEILQWAKQHASQLYETSLNPLCSTKIRQVDEISPSEYSTQNSTHSQALLSFSSSEKIGELSEKENQPSARSDSELKVTGGIAAKSMSARDSCRNINYGKEPNARSIEHGDLQQRVSPCLKATHEAIELNLKCQEALRILVDKVEAKERESFELQRKIRTLIHFEMLSRSRETASSDVAFGGHAAHLLLLHKYRHRKGQKRKAETMDPDSGEELSEEEQCKNSELKIPEDEDMASFKALRDKLPLVFKFQRWTSKETAALQQGVKQQVQETLMREIIQSACEAGEDEGTALQTAIDAVAARVLTEEDIAQHLPSVDWEAVAHVYVPSRSASACKIRYAHHVDPSVHRGQWSRAEDKQLLAIIERRGGPRHWEAIAQDLGTGRTPLQCLERYQRSLNPSFTKSEWTPQEDHQLALAVAELGEKQWQAVASSMVGRNASQCALRWCKVLHPDILRSGEWSPEESERLKFALEVYGPSNWRRIAALVPGRSDVKCRERWSNVLDPGIVLSEWDTDEDEALEEAVAQHGLHAWSTVAAQVSCSRQRTDNQCWRRYKQRHPEELQGHRLANALEKRALVRNFAGRRGARPQLSPSDFVKLPDPPPPPVAPPPPRPIDINAFRAPGQRRLLPRPDVGFFIKATPPNPSGHSFAFHLS